MSELISYEIGPDGTLEIEIDATINRFNKVNITYVSNSDFREVEFNTNFSKVLSPQTEKTSHCHNPAMNDIPVVETYLEDEVMIIKDSCFDQLLNYVENQENSSPDSYGTDDLFVLYDKLVDYLYKYFESSSMPFKFENRANSVPISYVNKKIDNHKADN